MGRNIFDHWSSIALAAVLLAVTLLLKVHPIIVLLTGGLAGLMIFKEKAN